MPLITVRVDDDLKSKMDDVPINWSEAIRDAISGIIVNRTRRNRIRAVQMIDRIRVSAPEGFDSTRIVRQWRDARRGTRGRR